MDKQQIKLINQLRKIRQRQFKQSRVCLTNGCTDKCINSHLLQRKGILSKIAVDNHFYILGQIDIYKATPFEPPAQFRRIGINEGMSLPLFCNKHDTELFAEIETENCDVNDYKTQLLFSYRSLCGELRKKEIQADIYGEIVNNPILRTNTTQMEKIEWMLLGFLMGVNDLKFFKEEMEKDIYSENEQKRFTFHTVVNEVDLDVCAAASYTPIQHDDFFDTEQNKPYTTMFTSIFSKNNKTNMITGYHNKHKTNWMIQHLEKLQNIDMVKFEKMVSNILIKRCETWAISPRLYDKLTENKKKEIILEFSQDLYSHDENLETKINIFEN